MSHSSYYELFITSHHRNTHCSLITVDNFTKKPRYKRYVMQTWILYDLIHLQCELFFFLIEFLHIAGDVFMYKCIYFSVILPNFSDVVDVSGCSAKRLGLVGLKRMLQ